MHTPHIIVAMDLPSADQIETTLSRMPDSLSWYKVGLELFCSGGPGVLMPFRNQHKQVFLDLKLHDIPRTVERAVASISKLGVHMTTLHAAGGKAMMQAAAESARSYGEEAPKLLAVTMLTSLDQADLNDIGVQRTPRDQVLAMAALAMEAGVDGVVASVQEAADLRRELGPDALIVTPGIRPAGSQTGDQKRVGTPADAKRAGSTHIVVGRPILEAEHPASVVERIESELNS